MDQPTQPPNSLTNHLTNVAMFAPATVEEKTGQSKKIAQFEPFGSLGYP